MRIWHGMLAVLLVAFAATLARTRLGAVLLDMLLFAGISAVSLGRIDPIAARLAERPGLSPLGSWLFVTIRIGVSLGIVIVSLVLSGLITIGLVKLAAAA